MPSPDGDLEAYLADLLDHAAEIMTHAKANSTWVQYLRCWNKFVLWCARLGLEPIPASFTTVLAYLTQVKLDSESFHVILMHACSITAFHERAQNFSAPCSHRSIQLFLLGAKKLLAKKSIPKKAFTQSIIKSFSRSALGADLRRPYSSPETFKANPNFWRAVIFIIFAYLSMARYSDFSLVVTEDITLINGVLHIQFHKRKNDQLRKGHSVELHPTGGEYCPVALYKKYLSFLSFLSKKRKPYKGFLLPPFVKSGKRFTPVPSSCCSYSTMRTHQDKLLRSISLNPSDFGLHSCKRGGVTDSAAAGNDPSETTIAAGWAKNSSMVEHYDENKISKAKSKVASSLRFL